MLCIPAEKLAAVANTDSPPVAPGMQIAAGHPVRAYEHMCITFPSTSF